MDKKVLLISHVADEDGITPVILSKLVYKNVDTVLIEPREADKAYLDNASNYDLIYITDVCVSEEVASKIDSDESLKSKILIFDHHLSNIELNKYDFINVVIENGDRKESATSIFYDYLCSIFDNELLHKDSTRGLVEQVRIIDTYDFKTEKDEEAHNLDLLFSILGRENYVDYFNKYITEHDCFEYTENEKFLIKLEQDKLDNYVSHRANEMFKVKIDGYTAGVVFAERYRSQLGNYLVSNNDIDFAVIISITRSVSYRGHDKVDLSVVSGKRGGGGHKNAAGSPIPSGILENITRMIFEGAEIIKEEENEK